jgi:hypothetical protein
MCRFVDPMARAIIHDIPAPSTLAARRCKPQFSLTCSDRVPKQNGRGQQLRRSCTRQGDNDGTEARDRLDISGMGQHAEQG